MKVWTKRDAIKQGIKSFIQQWGSSPKGTYGGDPRGINVCRELQKLDPETVDAKVVDDLIGHPSWTRNICDECQQDSDVVVFLGDHDGCSRVCPECLQRALDLAWKARGNQAVDEMTRLNQEMGFYDLPEK